MADKPTGPQIPEQIAGKTQEQLEAMRKAGELSKESLDLIAAFAG